MPICCTSHARHRHLHGPRREADQQCYDENKSMPKMTIRSGRERGGRIAPRRCMVVRSTPQAKRWKRYRRTLQSTFHVSSLPPTPMSNDCDNNAPLGFIFDSHITCSDQINHLSIHVIITFDFAVSAPILTSKLPAPLPHLLFTLSLITATLYTTTFQNLKHIVFRLFRTLLPGLWLRFPNSVTSHLFSNLLHWLKINERIEYKLLSLTTAQPTYLHSLISVQPLVLLDPHLLSPSLDHLHVHLL